MEELVMEDLKKKYNATLKKFEAEGIINRVQFNEIPPHVEYSLTQSGQALIHVFFELAKWADGYYNQTDLNAK